MVLMQLDVYGPFKRMADVSIASLGLIVLSPFLVVVSIAIVSSMGSPVFFKQERLGRNGSTFLIMKFRTMENRPRSEHQEILGAHPDVPYLGSLLRRLKIDELPQLWNVLKGDMSLVGPRPALPEHLNFYDDLSLRRLEVRPGLTGLAQISGNARLTWPERWALDVEYVETQSLWLDIRILVKTIAVVLLGEERFARGTK